MIYIITSFLWTIVMNILCIWTYKLVLNSLADVGHRFILIFNFVPLVDLYLYPFVDLYLYPFCKFVFVSFCCRTNKTHFCMKLWTSDWNFSTKTQRKPLGPGYGHNHAWAMILVFPSTILCIIPTRMFEIIAFSKGRLFYCELDLSFYPSQKAYSTTKYKHQIDKYK